MKVNKAEIMDQFFSKMATDNREGLDPMYAKRLSQYRPSRSIQPFAKNQWPDLVQPPRGESIEGIMTRQEVTKVEKKQIKKKLVAAMETIERTQSMGEILTEEKQQKSELQYKKEIEKLNEAKIRIEGKEQRLREREIADGIKKDAQEVKDLKRTRS